MNDNPEQAPIPGNASNPVPVVCSQAPFFQPTDWFSFGITTGLALAVYLFTLAPEVTLQFSGVFSTSAKYAGVAHAPGYPLWTLYAWVFTVLLPFSNIAWRVAVSSAVAGALACGLVALMVSRGGAMLVEGLPGFKRLEPKAENWLRVVSGYVGGLALAFDKGFWSKAVIVEAWPLALLLFTLVLCLLLRWKHEPEKRRYLYAALFVYALTLSTSQMFAIAALGLGFSILFVNPVLGRDVFAATTLLLAAGLLAQVIGVLPGRVADLAQSGSLWPVYVFVGVITALISIGLAVKTRAIFTQWRTLLTGGFVLAFGLSVYFCMPLASMTNPPMNWGYTRTVEGFFHAVSRGQYERIVPTGSLARFAAQLGFYGKVTLADFGLPYLVLALIPFWLVRRMEPQARAWLFGLVGVYLCLSLFLVIMLNPSVDAQYTHRHFGVFFSPSHLLLAVWTGCGVMLLGEILARPRAAPGVASV